MRFISFVAPAVLMVAGPVQATDWSAVSSLDAAAKRIGANVFYEGANAGSCAKKGLLGFYRPSTDTIVICQKRIHEHGQDLVETLQHETWHAAQDICTGRPVLSDQQMRAAISASDRAIMRSSYDSRKHRMEAEARALEKIPVAAFLRGLSHYCG